MNIMFVLHSKMVFSDVLESLTSKRILLVPLACLRPYLFCANAASTYSLCNLQILDAWSDTSVYSQLSNFGTSSFALSHHIQW